MAIRRFYNFNSGIYIWGDDVIPSNRAVDDIGPLKGNDIGFMVSRTFAGHTTYYSETTKAPLYFKKQNGMFSAYGENNSSGGFSYAPGRVIYERITDYKSYTLTDNSPIQDNKYRKFSNFTANVFEVKFNWSIESTIPPMYYNLVRYDKNSNLDSISNGNGEYIFTNGITNHPIDNILIRIRQVLDTSVNPYLISNYKEVARINVNTDLIGYPNKLDALLNYPNEQRLPGGNDAGNFQEQLKGYKDFSIWLVSDSTTDGTFWYINDKSENRKVDWVVDGSTGNERYLSGDRHYYLTIEPENSITNNPDGSSRVWWPSEIPNNVDVYEKSFPEYKIDGYIGLQRERLRYAGEGPLSTHDPMNLTRTDDRGASGPRSLYSSNLDSIRINISEFAWIPKSEWWGPNKNVDPNTLPSSGKYWSDLLPNYRGGNTNTTVPLKGSNVLSNINFNNNYSPKDKNIKDFEFYNLGQVVASRLHFTKDGYDPGWTKSTIKDLERILTSRDLVDIKSEYYAWFKTPPSRFGNNPIAFVNSEISTYKLPNVFRLDHPKITNTNDFQTKNATIYGKIYYDDLDFYLQSQFQSQVDFATSLQQYGDAQNIQSEIDKIKNKLKLPGNRPKSCGFILKEKTKNQTISKKIFSNLDTYQFNSYVRNLPTDILTTEGKSSNNSSAGISISYSFDLKTEENWTYQIWVTNVDGNTYYADPNKNSIDAINYPIVFGDIKLSSFPDPVASSFGFWYQVYNTWELFEVDKNNLNKRQLPYITKKKQPSDNRNYPVHYYMNQVFDQDINYQFRTTVEDFIRIKGDINGTYLTGTNSSIYVSLPWGENVKIVAPYINTDLINLTNDDKDKVRNLNIYMFSNINGYLLKNLKELDTLASADDVSSKPKSFIMSKSNPQNPITFSTNRDLSGVGLSYVGISKCNWIIQGFAPFNFLNQINKGQPNTTKGSEIIPLFINNEPYGGKGWHFLEKEGEFVWFDKLAPANNTPEIDVVSNLPIGGNVYDYYSDKSSNIKYLINNFISTYIQQEKFNLSFEYKNNSGFGLKIYTGSKLPYVSETEWFKTNIDELIKTEQVNLLGELKNNKVVTGDGFQICEFYGVEGNQFMFFVADPIIDFDKSTKDGILTKDADGYFLKNGIKGFGTYSVINIKNFKITSNYHVSNNLIHSVNGNFEKIVPDNATYSINLGISNNVFTSDYSPVTYYSKSGNSTFYSGVWENGIWNNGWRTDKTKREFYNIGKFYSYDRDRIWRFTIKGSKYSTSAFIIGDNVSIGNITAIDINDNRRLLKKFYKVVSVSDDQIEVEFETDFPLRRIEIDSINHRIILTKNIWLDGVFLNGYFNGVWNNGLFSGYPMITKMDESTWIDGIFNGGHFTANKKSINFIGSDIKTYESNNWLSLKTQTPHGLTKDDVISITYSSTNTIGYLGTTVVQDVVDDLQIITGIVWQDEYTNNIKDGQILTLLSTGLIQNFEFHSNNVSKKTSLDSMISERVFSYNSWIDVNYSNQSAVNIGRPPTYTEPTSNRIYSENNLYGYPTSDVLSSVSIFRDSYSQSKRKYFLGSKYKINSDYVGDVSSFEDYFDPTDTIKGKELFSERYGWEYVIPDSNVGIFPESQTYSSGNLQFTITDKTYVTGLTTNDGLFIYGYATNSNNMDISKTEFSNITDITLSNDKYIITTDNTSPWNTKQDFKLGVTISSTMILSRTPEPVTNDTPLQGKELKISVTNNGGILDLLPNTEISNRVNGEPKSTVEKGRYTMVEFDLIDYQSATSSTEVIRDGNMTHPPIHFYNINTVKRETKNSTGVSEISEFKSSYLPIYKNVNHLTTFGKNKQEFFFNKKNLMMTINGVGRNGIYGLDVYIDNLKFYEVDMVPFFQYFRNTSGNIGNINNSVQIPIYGTAPEIEQSEDDVIDSNKNQITNTFVSQLVTYDVPIPMGINWEQDYAIYRTQDIDGDDTNALYSGL